MELYKIVSRKICCLKAVGVIIKVISSSGLLPENNPLLIGLLSDVRKKCFIQGRFGHADIHAAS